jgi:hypothetical protein
VTYVVLIDRDARFDVPSVDEEKEKKNHRSRRDADKSDRSRDAAGGYGVDFAMDDEEEEEEEEEEVLVDKMGNTILKADEHQKECDAELSA